MHSQRINSLLWTLTALFSLSAIGALVAGIAMPLEIDEPPVARPTPRVPATSVDPIERYEVVWTRQLRESGDAPLPAEVAQTGSATMPITLVGTVGRSLALLRTNDGVVEVRGVGEQFGGAKVLSVEPSRVELLYNGQPVTLTRKKRPDEL